MTNPHERALLDSIDGPTDVRALPPVSGDGPRERGDGGCLA
ncbi:hypothetical protein [Streptomyces kasugaensis]|nr:hypothetical protein [Streptomyces kasugaensis]